MIRQKRTTIFICVEGESEESLVSFVKKIYSRGKTYITIENGYGGSPDSLAELAVKNVSKLDVEHKVIWFDNDKQLSTTWEKILVEENGFIILKSDPCLEAELFKMLGETKKYKKTESKKCKRDFQKKHLGGRNCIKIEDYHRLFDAIVLPEKKEFCSKPLTTLIKIASNES